ncbi:MAG: 50S ribosomal protein L25 [bacterium]|nr:50S ribosomal protein L25 [bacterium]
MSLVNLNIHPRTTVGKNENRRTRAAGRVPAVLYGKGRATASIELEGHAFEVALKHLGGRSAIFQLHQAGLEAGHIALLREVQRHPITDRILHVDLMEIPQGQPVTVSVHVHVSGFCAAVKSGEGSVAIAHDSVEVSCLPRDLPEFVEVDISELSLNDKIFAKDLKVPGGEIVSDPEMLVLSIKAASLFVEETPAATESAEGADGGAPAAKAGDSK